MPDAGDGGPAWRRWLRKDTHPAVQFIKYGIAGVGALAADQLVFYALSLSVIPALGPDDTALQILDHVLGWSAPTVQEALRLRNFSINTSLGFLVGNGVAYLLNIKWVFETGRHRIHHEILLFYLVSILSFLAGWAGGVAMIRLLALETTIANLFRVVTAVLINYAGRKYFIFKG